MILYDVAYVLHDCQMFLLFAIGFRVLSTFVKCLFAVQMFVWLSTLIRMLSTISYVFNDLSCILYFFNVWKKNIEWTILNIHKIEREPIDTPKEEKQATPQKKARSKDNNC